MGQVMQFGWIPNFGTGKAGRFSNFNTSNNQPVLFVTNSGIGSALSINHTGSSGDIAILQCGIKCCENQQSRKRFFNGGTQNSGADVAEAFDVNGKISEYEPGDILVISTEADRTVEKSSAPYSTLVAGVYATKPGVLLTEEHIDTDISNKVPMGVIGVIPTKVCLENGKIRRDFW
jgi:hypothetical protein